MRAKATAIQLIMQRVNSFKKMKVAHLTSVHRPFDSRIFHKECKSIAHAGNEAVLIVPHDRDEVRDGVRVRAITKPESRGERMVKTTWRVFQAALDEDADIYHFHDPELIPVGLLLKLRRKRVVYDVHEHLPKQILGKHWIRPWLRVWVARAANVGEIFGAHMFDGVIVANPATAIRFPKEKTVVVQNFPISGEFGCCRFLPYHERSVGAVYVGGLTEIRGIKEIVLAMSMMPESLGARLVLAGAFDPPELENEMKNLMGWERVDFLGWQSRDGVARVLGQARVGLAVLHPQPNYLENYPTKLFEYMSVGIPVVASDLPLCREIVQGSGCGILIDPMNPEAVAEAILWLLQHEKEAEAMGLRGQEAVRSRFSWNNEKEKLLNLYRIISAST
jgi:glycosyltransferase involved in cell wall biosynthesis